MAFMKLDVQFFTAYHVDTECGTEIVPTAIAGAIDLDAEPTTDAWEGLLMYCEGSRIEGVEKKTGFYARLSAPGYLDCTSWDGPHATREAALLSVRETYDVDADGETESDSINEAFDR